MRDATKPLLAVLRGERRDPPPIWLMRQAGRYLPEYRALREAKGGFMELLLDPEAAAEVTLQPVRRFGMDAAILFSDILVVPWAMGQQLRFTAGEGPELSPALKDAPLPMALMAMETRAEKLAPVIETVRRVKAGLPGETTLIGFAGGPFTVATYMVAGAGSKDHAVTRALFPNLPFDPVGDFAPIAPPAFAFREAGAPRPGQIAPPAGLQALGTAQFVPDSFRDGNQFSVRIDHELRPGKDRLSGNLYRTTSSTMTGGIRPAFNRPTDELTYFGSLNHTHTFSPNKLNEFRAGVMRLRGLPRVPRRLDIPVINITGLAGFGNANFPAGWFQTNFNYKNVFSWIKAAHTLKMGGELRYVRSNSYNTPNYIPTYQFPNILDFAYDDPLQVTRKVDPRTGIPATNVVGLRGREWALFINDDWKVSRTLTINLGLRYENYGSPREVNGLLRNFVFGQGGGYFERIAAGRVDIVPTFFPTDNNDWAPRFGWGCPEFR